MAGLPDFEGEGFPVRSKLQLRVGEEKGKVGLFVMGPWEILKPRKNTFCLRHSKTFYGYFKPKGREEGDPLFFPGGKRDFLLEGWDQLSKMDEDSV